MSLTTTTLTASVASTDEAIVVSSATGFAANSIVKIDEEFMQIPSTYTSGTTIPVLRGKNGTVNSAHPSSANVVVGLPSDFMGPNATVVVAYPLSGKRRKVQSYSASGAIALPLGNEDVVAILNGTSTLTMTLAAPTKDMDGAIVWVVANGKSASTVAVSGNDGVGNAGAGYRTLTFQTGGQVSVSFVACNGEWVALNTPITGTSTAISVAIS